MIYPITIELGDENHVFGFVTHNLLGCFSAGDTLNEAIGNAKEAIELWIREVLIPEIDSPLECFKVTSYFGIRLVRDAHSYLL